MTADYYEQVLEEKFVNDEDIYFKPFEDTFKFVMFSLVFGMIYPNPATEKWRIFAIFFFMLVMAPPVSMVFYDASVAYKEGDMDSIFRHIIVMGPFFAQYLKMALMFLYRKKGREVLINTNAYYEKLNSRPITHKRIAHKWLQRSFFLEKGWSYCVLVASFSFPITAFCKNIYSTLFDEEPRKYLAHNVRSPFGSNEDYPFYALMFGGTTLASGMYFLNFTGYDGLLVQLVLHVALRMSVCGEALKDAFSIKNKIMRRNAVREVIDEHIEICNYMEDINSMFKIWMSVITLSMVIHFCTCVYYLSKGHGRDMEFLSAFLAAFIYVFMICACGGLIEDQSEKLADIFYQCGWESVADQQCRYWLVFMLARSQKSFQLETLSNLAVNFELFVAICKMAYSLFTFLQQT